MKQAASNYFFLGFVFNLEDAGDVFLRNVG
jgi:hypothetical protein